MLKINIQLFGGRGSRSSSGGAGGIVSMPINFQPLTDAEASDIVDEQKYDINTRLAIKEYISPTATANGYSMSQNLNYAIDNGLPLSANEQYMDDKLSSAMHDLGKDTLLYRGAHSDLLTTLGISNYQNMTDAQLNAALTGTKYTTKSYSSTSYDLSKNPFLSGSQAGGREIIMKIKAPKTTKCVYGARNQAEVILNKGTSFRISGAKFTGNTVFPRIGGTYRQVELEIEID